jgi:hypothetical protein
LTFSTSLLLVVVAAQDTLIAVAAVVAQAGIEQVCQVKTQAVALVLSQYSRPFCLRLMPSQLARVALDLMGTQRRARAAVIQLSTLLPQRAVAGEAHSHLLALLAAAAVVGLTRQQPVDRAPQVRATQAAQDLAPQIRRHRVALAVARVAWVATVRQILAARVALAYRAALLALVSGVLAAAAVAESAAGPRQAAAAREPILAIQVPQIPAAAAAGEEMRRWPVAVDQASSFFPFPRPTRRPSQVAFRRPQPRQAVAASTQSQPLVSPTP